MTTFWARVAPLRLWKVSVVVAALVSILVRLPGRSSSIQDSCHAQHNELASFPVLSGSSSRPFLLLTPKDSTGRGGVNLCRLGYLPCLLQPMSTVRHSHAHGDFYRAEDDLSQLY